uniref:FISNA domain-containing protein n=1 Tax=Knipowitschia caucasica TaxID=637954 RepID=A0AAV2M513_KNICA
MAQEGTRTGPTAHLATTAPKAQRCPNMVAVAQNLDPDGVSSGRSQRKLKVELQQKFECVFEGIAKAGTPTLLKQIYIELYITEGGSSEVNQEHERSREYNEAPEMSPGLLRVTKLNLSQTPRTLCAADSPKTRLQSPVGD